METKENKQAVYVVTACVTKDDGNDYDVLGVYDNLDEANKVAINELKERYSADLNGSYNGDEEALIAEFDKLQYYANYEYYFVSVEVVTRLVNVLTVKLATV